MADEAIQSSCWKLWDLPTLLSFRRRSSSYGGQVGKAGWIAALPSSYAKASEDKSVAARNDEDGATRESFHRAVGIT